MKTESKLSNLSENVMAVADFVIKHRKPGCVWDWDFDRVMRFTAFCFLTGKIAVSADNGKIEAVVYYWPAHREHVEARHENNRPQFEWAPCKPGDSLFLGDIIGSRRAIGKIYAALVRQFPNVMLVPILTYRRDKLVELSKPTIERFVS